MWLFLHLKEKGRDLTQSYDKSPYNCWKRQFQKAKWQHKNAAKNFDYKTIADRLRTVSWSNYSQPTGVVKPVNGIQTFLLATTVVAFKSDITAGWKSIVFMLNLNIFENYSVRLHSICGTDLGWSIKMATDNIH